MATLVLKIPPDCFPEVHEKQGVCRSVGRASPYRGSLKPTGPYWTIGAKTKEGSTGSIAGIDSVLVTSEDAATKMFILLQL
mmetsp:Transcript_117274/g.233745  ORF Transcript_117274/g.233745 Transcript_117274/m.233745 type:complete len:81 (+) Transcript_117274:289-531(+)